MLAPETIIEEQLDNLLGDIEKAMDCDVLTFCGPIDYGIDDQIRYEIEALPNKKGRLGVILETPGGSIDVAERMANTFRHHYSVVEFVVPNFAMSAGTVLVMSGDSIHMDYYSVLGPIDPQVRGPGGDLIPALGYIEKYRALIEKSRRGKITTAEVTYLISKFDPAEMYQFEQAVDLSINLLKEWLVKFKFKDWKKTRTRGIKVTDKMKKKRAEEIARNLNKTDLWHAHSRGISMEVLRRDLRLEIEDFAASPCGAKIKDYYRLLQDYMLRRGSLAVTHRRGRYFPLFEQIHSH